EARSQRTTGIRCWHLRRDSLPMRQDSVDRRSMPMRMRQPQSGATMMEVLVSILIVVIGLLGLAGLQSRINLSEMESFQRAQALVLLQDMVDRINANRKNAALYVTTQPLGT